MGIPDLLVIRYFDEPAADNMGSDKAVAGRRVFQNMERI